LTPCGGAARVTSALNFEGRRNVRRLRLAAIVCAALAGLPADSRAQQPPAPTFSRDVAPILFARCTSCHRPAGIAPFSLLSYQDARQRARQIAEVTASRLMPPWKPEPGDVSFEDSRALTDRELDVIQRWLAAGALEGNPSDMPALPVWTDQWQLGRPDLVVTMTDAYLLPADGPDVFRTFVLPIPNEEARWVAAIEFRPETPRAVHHANLGIDRTRSSRRLDAQDPEAGYTGGMVADASYPPGHMLGWTPGQRPRPSPEGAPWRLERLSDLVAQLHLQPTGKPEPVKVSVAFHFTEIPPTRAPVGLRLGSQTIDIAAGDAAYQITDSYVIPVDADLLAVQPHAHNLARRIEATATLPDGSTRQLMTISDWDFRWQDVYRLSAPLRLPRGTIVSMRFVYDNSSANPRNPHQPPQRVVWGQNTADEMGDFWLQLMPVNAAETVTLNDDVTRKRREQDLLAYTKLLETEPANPLRHDAVAMLYLQGGDLARAEAHMRESLALNPSSAPTHYNLGMTLSAGRRFAEAVLEFRQAVDLDPDYADAFNNLGAMLHVTGQFDAAEQSYRRAAELRPDSAEAHNNLGRLLSSLGRGPEAVESLRRAVELRPESPLFASGLAWALATSIKPAADPGEAVSLAERAVSATSRRDATALDALAAAYAAAGRFDLAVPAAREAAIVAELAGNTAMATIIRQRMALYERKIAYRLAP